LIELVSSPIASSSVSSWRMLVDGSGAGILNAEAARVAMTAIPDERAGMAAGSAGLFGPRASWWAWPRWARFCARPWRRTS
jgi:hypothetical protein